MKVEEDEQIKITDVFCSLIIMGSPQVKVMCRENEALLYKGRLAMYY